jgi:TRAP-type transport system small permease protein
MNEIPDSPTGARVNRFIERFTLALIDVAGIALLLLMVLTVADVFMRYVFNAPIRGVWDATQITMVIVTFLGFAYSGHVGGHIVIDLVKWRSKKSVRRIDVAVDVVSAIVMLVIAWRSAIYAVDVAYSGASSMTLLVPFWPLVSIVAFGSLMFALVLLANAIWPDSTPSRRPLSPE